jgi:aryl-alcohol dehydrogenase
VNITAAVARAAHSPLTLESLALEDPRPDEVLVRVVATGICHTDPAMRDDAYPVPKPIVLGHEGAGVVERIGAAVTRVMPGDQVLMSYNSCGSCASCRISRPGFCHDFFGRNFGGCRPDGSSPISKAGVSIHSNFFGQSSFATHSISRERNIVKVPADASLETLCPLGCGVQTGAGAVMNALRVTPGSSLAIFGTGPVGLSAVLAAHVSGAGRIIAIDLVDSRLQLAREFGATHTINPRNTDVVTELKNLTGAGVEFALDTTAHPQVIRQATDALAPRGMCAILGASKVGTEISLDVVHMMTGGRQLRGTVEGDSSPDVLIPQLLTLHAQGRFPFDRMITFYDFADINQAIEDTERGACIKAVLRMPPPGASIPQGS